jgi:hypothetical protein
MARMSADAELMAQEGSLNLEFVTASHDWQEGRHRTRERLSSIEISYMETALAWPGAFLRDRVDLVRALEPDQLGARAQFERSCACISLISCTTYLAAGVAPAQPHIVLSVMLPVLLSLPARGLLPADSIAGRCAATGNTGQGCA